MTRQRNMDGSIRRTVSEVMVLPPQSSMAYMFFAMGDRRLNAFTPKSYTLGKNTLHLGIIAEMANRFRFEGSIAFLNAVPSAVVFESIVLKVNHTLGKQFFKQMLYIRLTERVSGNRYTLRFANAEASTRGLINVI